jgi:hypothetical protein
LRLLREAGLLRQGLRLLCEAGVLRKGLRLREVLQVPGDPGPRPVRERKGHVRGEGLLLRAEVLLQGRQVLLPGTRLLCEAGLLRQARLLREGLRLL